MDYKNIVENAPILEFDEDSAQEAKNYFFSAGKKKFEQFNRVKDLGITKCLFFFPRSFDKLTEIYEKCEMIYEFKSASTRSPIYLYDNKLLIALSPLGGPGAANLMEELNYIGIKTIIACGTCGSIVDINMEKYFIPTFAIRDEGLSYHYMPASRMVETTNRVNNALEKSVKNFNRESMFGTIWTIDAMYRETPNRTQRRVGEGAIGVDMECASLAACAKFNNIEFGELLYFTDKVGNAKWEWRFYDKISLRTELVKICLETLEML